MKSVLQKKMANDLKMIKSVRVKCSGLYFIYIKNIFFVLLLFLFVCLVYFVSFLTLFKMCIVCLLRFLKYVLF